MYRKTTRLRNPLSDGGGTQLRVLVHIPDQVSEYVDQRHELGAKSIDLRKRFFYLNNILLNSHIFLSKGRLPVVSQKYLCIGLSLKITSGSRTQGKRRIRSCLKSIE